MAKENSWYNLIKTALEKGQIVTGLTIPYILGAQKITDTDFVIDDKSIYNLLNEITNSTTELRAVLKKCGTIEQYVLGLSNAQFCRENLETELFFKNQMGVGSLYVINDAKSLGKTLEEISVNLTKEYKDYLKAEKYSWDSDSKLWREFTGDEKERILNT